MFLTPLHNEPALFAEEISTLIIADLHIGIEYELLTAGARIPGKMEEMKQRLLKTISKYEIERLVIVGDLKHNVPTSSFREERDIPRFIDELFEVVKDIELVPGNHDGGIGNYLPKRVNVHSSKGAVIENMGIWHGHTWPSKDVMAADIVVTAHNHPVAVFVDGVGARSTERCWLKGRWNREKTMEKYEEVGNGFIMVPAFNDLCGGTYVNEVKPRLLGAVMRNGLADVDTAEIYLLDGTYLGTVADNRVEIQRSK